MKKKQQQSFFWASYSDLMTSLFFIMLVMFILVIVIMKHTNDKLSDSLAMTQVTLEEQKKLNQIDEQFKPLIEKKDKFIYDSLSRKYVAKDFIGKEIFDSQKAQILPEFKNKTISIGKTIEVFLAKLSRENKSFKYLLIIEGNAGIPITKRKSIDDNYAYRLSFNRALAVYQLWRQAKINLRKYNTEIQICGSGFNGLGRDKREDYNKRFQIQIIPLVTNPNIRGKHEK